MPTSGGPGSPRTTIRLRGFGAWRGISPPVGGVAHGGLVPSSALHGWVFRDGTFAMLPRLAGRTMTPSGINTAGDIVGRAELVNLTPQNASTYYVAARWPAGQPGVVIPLGGSGDSEPSSIDTDGTIVGAIGGLPYVWYADGRHAPLPMPPGDTGGYPGAIRQGWAVGSVTSGGVAMPLNPAVWNLATGTVIRLSDYSLMLLSVSTDGTAAGRYFPTNTDQRAVTYRDGVIRQLPTVPSKPTPTITDSALSISADGTMIVGISNNAPVIWHC